MELRKGVGVLALATGLLTFGAYSTAAAQTKEIRGQVVTVSDAALTIKAGEQTLNFVVDGNTLVEANGASTRTRRAKAEGKESAQIKVTDYVKAGGAVLVNYREVDGRNRALMIRPIAAAGSQGPPTKNLQGKVKSISGSTLILDQDGRDLSFAVDRDTDVLARGGTRSTKRAGGSLPITDFVQAGDLIRVQYRDVNGSMKALEIQVLTARTVPVK